VHRGRRRPMLKWRCLVPSPLRPLAPEQLRARRHQASPPSAIISSRSARLDALAHQAYTFGRSAAAAGDRLVRAQGWTLELLVNRGGRADRGGRPSGADKSHHLALETVGDWARGRHAVGHDRIGNAHRTSAAHGDCSRPRRCGRRPRSADRPPAPGNAGSPPRSVHQHVDAESAVVPQRLSGCHEALDGTPTAV